MFHAIPLHIFILLMTIAGMWNILDGWFSLSLYLKDKNQTWHQDHYIRVIRIFIGVMLLYMACQMLWYATMM